MLLASQNAREIILDMGPWSAGLGSEKLLEPKSIHHSTTFKSMVESNWPARSDYQAWYNTLSASKFSWAFDPRTSRRIKFVGDSLPYHSSELISRVKVGDRTALFPDSPEAPWSTGQTIAGVPIVPMRLSKPLDGSNQNPVLKNSNWSFGFKAAFRRLRI